MNNDRPRHEQLERWIIIQAVIINTLSLIGTEDDVRRAVTRLCEFVEEYQNV
jgi:hypothetical protein